MQINKGKLQKKSYDDKKCMFIQNLLFYTISKHMICLLLKVIFFNFISMNGFLIKTEFLHINKLIN